MALIVQKFGGSSVKDRDRIFNVARIVANTHNAGNDVVVVVSAQGDTTTRISGSCRITSMLFTTKGSTGLPVKSFGSRMYFTSTGSPARRACGRRVIWKRWTVLPRPC